MRLDKTNAYKERSCPTCGKTFKPTVATKDYCSTACRDSRPVPCIKCSKVFYPYRPRTVSHGWIPAVCCIACTGLKHNCESATLLLEARRRLPRTCRSCGTTFIFKETKDRCSRNCTNNDKRYIFDPTDTGKSKIHREYMRLKIPAGYSDGIAIYPLGYHPFLNLRYWHQVIKNTDKFYAPFDPDNPVNEDSKLALPNDPPKVNIPGYKSPAEMAGCAGETYSTRYTDRNPDSHKPQDKLELNRLERELRHKETRLENSSRNYNNVEAEIESDNLRDECEKLRTRVAFQRLLATKGDSERWFPEGKEDGTEE